jgi:hypothetical protein
MMEQGGENSLIPLVYERIDRLLPYQMISTDDYISAGRTVELFRFAQACKSHAVVDILPVGPAGGRVDETGEPVDFRWNLSNSLEL